uniref:Uncharacterized protein n=1 Tax=Anguilla anguilla TaxID=7936 RepID=A0A0E9W4A0_ANGAN
MTGSRSYAHGRVGKVTTKKKKLKNVASGWLVRSITLFFGMFPLALLD